MLLWVTYRIMLVTLAAFLNIPVEDYSGPNDYTIEFGSALIPMWVVGELFPTRIGESSSIPSICRKEYSFSFCWSKSACFTSNWKLLVVLVGFMHWSSVNNAVPGSSSYFLPFTLFCWVAVSFETVRECMSFVLLLLLVGSLLGKAGMWFSWLILILGLVRLPTSKMASLALPGVSIKTFFSWLGMRFFFIYDPWLSISEFYS